MKLTAKTVAALTIPNGKSEAIYFDEDVPGLGLRLREGGAARSARWIFQYRIGAKQRRISLGSVSAISSARAHELAGELHARVRLGEDPAATKAEERVRAIETMGATLDAYLAHKRAHLKPSSLIEIERHLRKNCRPLHGLRLDKIDRRTIAARLNALATNNGPVTANRVAAALSAFFAWCIREGLASSNPAAGVNRQPEQSRSRVLADHELRAIWAATADAGDYAAVVRLLMCCGQRANEIAALKFSEIVGDRIVLPPARTKNKREHSIPITDPMRAILDGRPRRDGRDLVFGRRQNRPLSAWSFCKATLDNRIKAAGHELPHWTHHDLRRTMATRMANDLDIAPHIIEAVLNHVSGHKAGIAGVYNLAGYTGQMRHALTAWGEHLLAIVEGRPISDKIVPLRA
jgi:integrase